MGRNKSLQIRKEKWIVHSLRKPPHAIERQALDWNPQIIGKVGRSRGIWRSLNEDRKNGESRE